MLHKLVKKFEDALGVQEVSAHCDIPCGIYDPSTAQIAALTVIRMIDLSVKLLEEHPNRDLEVDNSLARYIASKEEHAEKAKHEVRVIWGDYFKPPHIAEYPEIHETAHKVMMLGSKVRQTADRATAIEFLEEINKFAEIFWKTKGVETKRVKAPYLPGEEVVYPVL